MKVAAKSEYTEISNLSSEGDFRGLGEGVVPRLERIDARERRRRAGVAPPVDAGVGGGEDGTRNVREEEVPGRGRRAVHLG